jgi:hypothetical protein
MSTSRQLLYRIRRFKLLGVSCVALALVWAPAASAACSASVRADSIATQQMVDQLTAEQSPAAEDIRWLYARARSSCLDMRPARAIATATLRLGQPTANRRARVLGVDLIGLRSGSTYAWRMDLARTATRYIAARSNAEQVRYRTQLAAASWGSRAVTYAADPTRLTWDPGQQSAVVAILGRSSKPDPRRRADAGVRAFAVGSRAGSLARLPTLQHLVIANRVLTGAAGSSSNQTASVARNVAARALVRVRASRARAWSRIDGEWATITQHRTLVGQARLMLRRAPHATTSAALRMLERDLTTPARVSFSSLPTGAFYPWPRDGAFDSQSVIIDVDKPAVVKLLIYGDDGGLVRSIAARVVPGHSTLAWDGSSSDGSIAPVGDYRYNVDVRDPAGNRVRVPGLQQFRIARDTVKPTIVSTTVRIVGNGASRRVIAAWDVDEQHSPQVRSWLVLRSGTQSTSIRLHDSIQQATVRRALSIAPGTWSATMVFIDGSGNRSQRRLASITLR